MSASTFNKTKLSNGRLIHFVQKEWPPDGITIKPYMLIQEQLAERLLMKERWSLTQSWINKKDIKIKSSILYLQGKKYAKVSNSALIRLSLSTSHSLM